MRSGLESPAAKSPSPESATAESPARSSTVVEVVEGRAGKHVLVILGNRFHRVLARTVGGRDKRPGVRVGVPQVGQNLGDQRTTMGIQFRVGIVPRPLDEHREGHTPHPGSDFQNLVFPVRSEFGRFQDKILLMQNEIGSFRIGLHLVKVGPHHGPDRVLIGNSKRTMGPTACTATVGQQTASHAAPAAFAEPTFLAAVVAAPALAARTFVFLAEVIPLPAATTITAAVGRAGPHAAVATPAAAMKERRTASGEAEHGRQQASEDSP